MIFTTFMNSQSSEQILILIVFFHGLVHSGRIYQAPFADPQRDRLVIRSHVTLTFKIASERFVFPTCGSTLVTSRYSKVIFQNRSFFWFAETCFRHAVGAAHCTYQHTGIPEAINNLYGYIGLLDRWHTIWTFKIVLYVGQTINAWNVFVFSL